VSEKKLEAAEPPVGKAREVLAVVEQHNLATGFPATNRDVSVVMGYASTATAHTHLQSLKRRGFVVQRGKQGYVAAELAYRVAA